MTKSLREGIALLMWSSFVLLAFILSDSSVFMFIKRVLGIDTMGNGSYLPQLLLSGIVVSISTFLFAFIPDTWILFPRTVKKKKISTLMKIGYFVGLFCFEILVFATLGAAAPRRSLAMAFIIVAFVCLILSSRLLKEVLRFK